MFITISNKLLNCNHTPLKEIGLIKIIPILVYGIDKREVKEAIKFIQDEYSEYFQILNSKTKIVKIYDIKIYKYNIDIINLKKNQIILHKKLEQKIYLFQKYRPIEKSLIIICNELISTYRNFVK